MMSGVLVDEAARLAADLRLIIPMVGSRLDDLDLEVARGRVEDVLLVGCGDCLAAAYAAHAAFAELARLRCLPLTPHRVLAYGLEAVAPRAERTLMIAASVSGATPSVVEALVLGRRSGVRTLAVTSKPGSPVTEVADQTVEIALRDEQPSPGLRTYQATLAALLLLGSRLGAPRDASGATAAKAELVELPDRLDVMLPSLADVCGDAVALMDDGPAVVLGGGPSYGSALFVAAKLVEAAGIFAAARGIDEWWHVERFALPLDMPVIVLAPGGASRPAALGVAEQAHTRGRRVIGIGAGSDRDMANVCATCIPVEDSVRECWAPLLHSPVAAFLATGVAKRFNRIPFRADRQGAV